MYINNKERIINMCHSCVTIMVVGTELYSTSKTTKLQVYNQFYHIKLYPTNAK